MFKRPEIWTYEPNINQISLITLMFNFVKPRLSGDKIAACNIDVSRVNKFILLFYIFLFNL